MATPPLEIPYKAPFTLATMEPTHAHMEITPDDDADLRFELALPKSWAHSKPLAPASDAPHEPRELASFAQSAERGAPVVAVTLTTVPFEVPIDTWTRLRMEAEGWSVIGGSWFSGPNGSFYEVTGMRTVDDLQFVRRTSARVDGSKIFSVNTLCARDRWELAKQDFWTAHVTFALPGGKPETRMEAWLRGGAKAPDFATAYPMTWETDEAEFDSNTLSGLHLRLTDATQENLLAYMLIRAQRHQPDYVATLDALLVKTIATMQQSGLKLEGELQRHPSEEDPHAVAVEGWLGGFVGAGHLADGGIFVRVGFVQRDAVVVTLVLYSPKFADDTVVALRAQRAFEIARSKLQLSS
jgi:hypothetical protein